MLLFPKRRGSDCKDDHPVLYQSPVVLCHSIVSSRGDNFFFSFFFFLSQLEERGRFKIPRPLLQEWVYFTTSSKVEVLHRAQYMVRPQ